MEKEIAEKIVQVTKVVVSNVDKLDDIVEDNLDSVKEYTKIGGEVFSFVKPIITIYDFHRKYKLKTFLESYARKFKSDSINSKETVEKEMLDFTIEKLKMLGVLSYGPGGIGSAGNARGIFMIAKLTKDFYNLIKESSPQG